MKWYWRRGTAGTKQEVNTSDKVCLGPMPFAEHYSKDLWASEFRTLLGNIFHAVAHRTNAMSITSEIAGKLVDEGLIWTVYLTHDDRPTVRMWHARITIPERHAPEAWICADTFEDLVRFIENAKGRPGWAYF